MALYRVRFDHTLHLGPGQTLGPGDVFEPTPEVLASQGHKLELAGECDPVTVKTGMGFTEDVKGGYLVPPQRFGRKR
jgi:hypothetical protein